MVLSLWAGLPGLALAEETAPWSLRNRVSFTSTSAVLEYAEKSGAWRILSNAGETVVESEGFLARLGEGRSLGSAGLAPAELHREHFEGSLGDGTYYTSRFAVQDGIAFEYRVASFEDRPFVVMSLSVSNRSADAVMLERLDVAVFSAPDAVSLGPGAQYESLPLAMRGGQAILDEAGSSLMGRFEDAAAGICITIGVGGGRDASSGVQFEKVTAEQRWGGRISTLFSPALKLLPGETVRSADVVVVYGLSDATESEENYLWAAGTLWPDAAMLAPPLTWLTQEASGDFDALLKEAGRWRGTSQTRSLKHVLIPAGWEGRAGSMQGATPRYPKNIGNAAETLRKRGFTPGITIDPLAALSGVKDWVYSPAAGGTWLNPRDAEAQVFAQERIQGLAGQGFEFFAIKASPIPDAALQHFGLTRSMASALAFKMVREAIPNLPVYPATAADFPSTDRLRSNVRRALTLLAAYGVPAAPIRLEPSSLSEGGPLSIATLLNWPGPLEIVGVATNQVRRDFGEFLRQRADAHKSENMP